MIDIGWSELLVIGIVALIVVGPKDLPIMFRRMGEFTGKARAMAREFSSAMDKAADEAGVKDVQRDLRKIADPKQMGLDAIDDATSDLKSWSPDGTTKAQAGAKVAPLSPERAQAAEKIRAAAAQKALERHERERQAKADAAAQTDDTPT